VVNMTTHLGVEGGARWASQLDLQEVAVGALCVPAPQEGTVPSRWVHHWQPCREHLSAVVGCMDVVWLHSRILC
jgi:hypothetical protein